MPGYVYRGNQPFMPKVAGQCPPSLIPAREFCRYDHALTPENLTTDGKCKECIHVWGQRPIKCSRCGNAMTQMNFGRHRRTTHGGDCADAKKVFLDV